jgi:hypothetical protein
MRLRSLSLLATVVALLTTSGCTGTFQSVASARARVADRHWAPRPGLRWQIQLQGAFDPDAAANVYDLDPYATSQQTVGSLNAHGRQTICHLDVGVTDPDLPDAARLDGPAAGADAGDGRRWLDIRRWDLIAPVLTDRMTLCRDKGFEAVDADEAFGADAPTGFDLTMADQLTYDKRVAALARRLGLGVTVRATPALAASVEPFTDFTVVGGCFHDADCVNYFVYIQAGKAVFDVETDAADGFCALARAYGFSAIRKRDSLDAFVQPC